MSNGKNGHIPWGSLPPEERERRQAAHRRRTKLRKLGKPSTVDAAPVRERVRRLHDECGLSFAKIAELAGPNPNTGTKMGQSTTSDLYRGYRHDPEKPMVKIPRTTAVRIMAIPYQAPSLTSEALVCGVGTRRRMQALVVIGFGVKFQATYLGCGDYQYMWRLATGKRSSDKDRNTWNQVEVGTRERVKAMYDKLHLVDPLDMGCIKSNVSRAKGVGRKYGWAGPGCWDDDTIDDPGAFPEYTGACGTIEGYYLHLKHDILVKTYHSSTTPGKRHRKVQCKPCLAARAESATQTHFGKYADYDDREVIDLADAGMPHSAIAHRFGMSVRTVERILRAERDRVALESD